MMPLWTVAVWCCVVLLELESTRITSESENLVRVLPTKIFKHRFRKEVLVPVPSVSGKEIYRLAPSTVLACIQDILQYWKEKKVVFIYQEGENDTYTFPETIRLGRLEIEFVKWENATLHKNPEILSHAMVILCCEESLPTAFITACLRTKGITDNKSVIIISRDEPQLSNENGFPYLWQILHMMPKKNGNGVHQYLSLHRVNAFELYDVFVSADEAVLTNQRFLRNKILDWDLHYGLEFNDVTKFNPSTKLKGRILQSAILQFNGYSDVNFSDCSIRSGYFKDILKIVSEYLNVRLKYMCQAGLVMGAVSDNGTASGVLALLQNRSVQVGIVPFLVTGGRYEILTLPPPIHIIHMAIWWKVDKAVYNSAQFSNTHFSAFPLYTWIAILVSALLSLSILAVTVRKTSCYFSKHQKVNNRIMNLIKWCLFGEFLEEAMVDAQGISTKIILGTMILSTSILFYHFTAIFKSFLMYQPINLPFTNMEELSLNMDYRVSTVMPSGYYDYIKTANNASRNIWKRMNENNGESLAIDVDDGLKKVCELDKYAFMFDIDGTTAYTARARFAADCPLNAMKTEVGQDYVFIGIRKDFIYKESLTLLLTKLMEGGILRRFARRYFMAPSDVLHVKDASDSQDATFAFEVRHVMTPLFILLAGIIMSIISLLVELMCKTVL